MTTSLGPATAVALIMSASIANATCVNADVQTGSGRWFNGCNVGFSIVWKDENRCQPNSRAEYPCADFVSPHSQQSAILKGQGRITWVECESPGGPGDVIAVERPYGNVVCSD